MKGRGGVGLGESALRPPIVPISATVVVLELPKEGVEGSTPPSKSPPRLADPPGGGGIKNGNPFEPFADEALGGGSNCGGTGLGGAGHLLPLEADAPESRLSV